MESVQRGHHSTVPDGGPAKARVLCLHGFRQTAGGFYGRTHAFRKALKHQAVFDFLEGGLELAPTAGAPGEGSQGEGADGSAGRCAAAPPEEAATRPGVRKCWWQEVTLADGTVSVCGASPALLRAQQKRIAAHPTRWPAVALPREVGPGGVAPCCRIKRGICAHPEADWVTAEQGGGKLSTPSSATSAPQGRTTASAGTASALAPQCWRRCVASAFARSSSHARSDFSFSQGGALVALVCEHLEALKDTEGVIRAFARAGT